MRLNIYLLDWAIVPAWCSIFALGGRMGMLIMLPVMFIMCIVNSRWTKKTVSLVLVDINLMMAAVAGIVLNSLLFTRFVYADRDNVSTMMVEIFASVFFITFMMIVSLVIKDVKRTRIRRIINALADSEDDDDDEEDDDDDYPYDDDEEDDDDDLFDDEDEEREERRMISGLLKKRKGSDEEEPEDDGDEEAPNEREPKFKVIKKK